MNEYNTKWDKRISKRKNKDKKQIKHSYWENWGKPQWYSITKTLKKLFIKWKKYKK